MLVISVKAQFVNFLLFTISMHWKAKWWNC